MEEQFINPFYIPPSNPDERKAYSTSYGNAAFRQAVVIVAARWTQRLKRAKEAGRYNGRTTITPDTLLMNFALHGQRIKMHVIMAEVQEEYKHQLKERHNVKRSMDIVKK